jgi:hypothetical protein
MTIASPRIALPLAALLGLAACAAPRVGVDDLDVLSAQAPDEIVTSALSVEAIAACFQERADFLPLSRFVMSETHWRYSLAGYGSAYESVTIRPTATGSEAEIRLGAYDARWARNFEDGRAQALRACAASDTNG